MAVSAQRAGSSRRARPGLTRDAVIRAAIEVADAEGVDAITMRRLADVLDVHPTSIYNHLPNKEAILDGVVETLFVDAAPPLTVADWREWVRGFAAAMRRIAVAHPGAFAVFLQRPATGPVASQHAEAALDAFRRAGLSPLKTARALHGISLAVLGMAIDEGPIHDELVEPDHAHLTPERFPRIHEVEEADKAVRLDTGPTWDLVVESLVAGYAITLGIEN